jgi:hypothetical protein
VDQQHFKRSKNGLVRSPLRVVKITKDVGRGAFWIYDLRFAVSASSAFNAKTQGCEDARAFGVCGLQFQLFLFSSTPPVQAQEYAPGFAAIMRIQFLIDRGQMGMDGGRTHAKALRNIFVLHAAREAEHDFVFPLAERARPECAANPVKELAHYSLGCWAQGQQVVPGINDGADQVAGGGGLGDEAASAGHDGLQNGILVRPARKHDDTQVWQTSDEMAGAFDAGHARHPDVHEDNGRKFGRDALKGLLTAGVGLEGEAFPVGGEHVPGQAMDRLLVVHDRNIGAAMAVAPV